MRELIDRQLSQLSNAERHLLELASAAGLEFSAAALVGSANDIDAIERQCETLVDRQLLRRSESARWPDGTVASGYWFRHALYRHAIYEAVPANLRGKLHLRIGRRLERGYAKHANGIAAVLADHFAMGGDDRRAAIHERKAAETASLRGAAREAQQRLRRALTHIARWPPGRARDAEEIRTQISLGTAHTLVEGFGAPAAVEAFNRAFVLSRRIPDSGTLIPTLDGLYNYCLTSGDWRGAKRFAARIHRVAEADNTGAHSMIGHNAVGYTKWRAGRYMAALPHIAKVVTAYRVRRDAALSTVFSEDPGVACRYYAAVTAIMLGDVDAAGRHLTAGMAIARALKQPFAIAEILWAHCVVAHECGDAALVERRAHELLATCEDGNIDVWRRPGRAFAGWGAAMRGDQGGLERMGAVLQEWRDIAMFESMHYMLALYAEACMRHGRLAVAEAALAEALTLVQDTGECWYEAELHRLRGEVAARRPPSGKESDQAACFRQALRVARRQGARLLELRARVSLAKIHAARGEHATSIRILAPVRPLVERAARIPVATAAKELLLQGGPK